MISTHFKINNQFKFYDSLKKTYKINPTKSSTKQINMILFIAFLVLFFCFFQTQSQNRNVYATVKDQHGNAWNNLEVKLYINQTENSFETAQLQDSLVIVNGLVEFQNIVITQSYEMPEKTDLIVFPNPCSGIFKINFRESSSTKLVNLFNANAQKIKSFRVNKHLTEQEFDISEFADGIYFCEIISEKKQSSIKIIKNRFQPINLLSDTTHQQKAVKQQLCMPGCNYLETR